MATIICGTTRENITRRELKNPCYFRLLKEHSVMYAKVEERTATVLTLDIPTVGIAVSVSLRKVQHWGEEKNIQEYFFADARKVHPDVWKEALLEFDRKVAAIRGSL